MQKLLLSRSILAQSSWLIVAQVLTRLIGFGYTLILGRQLGVSDFGLLAIALAYFGLVPVLSDLGFSRYLIREVAKDQSQINQLFWPILSVRVGLTLLFSILTLVFLYFSGFDAYRLLVVAVVLLGTIPQAIAMTLDSVYASLRKLEWSAFGLLALSVSSSVFGLIFLTLGWQIWAATIALLFGQLMYVGFLGIGLGLYKLKLKFNFSKINLTQIIHGALPYGLLAILGTVSYRLDTLLLGLIRGDFETGIYAMGYKFLDAVTFIPGAVALALFPVLAKMYLEKPSQIRQVYNQCLVVMAGLGLLISVSFWLVLPLVIDSFLPQYQSSIRVIQILALAMPFIFMHIPSNQVLLSTDRYLKQLLVLYSSFLIINLSLSLWLIPLYGYMAAAWLTVVSEIITFITFYLFIRFKIK